MKTRIASLARRWPVRIGAVLVLAVAAGFGAWLVVKDDDGDQGATQFEGGAPAPATAASLRALSRAVGHDVYWVGPRRSYTYELTRTGDGSIYVRYLPPGVAIGDERPNFLTVGTYPYPRPLRMLRREARRDDAIVRRVRGGGLAVARGSKPESVYLAYPDSDFLLEVFDPSAARARRLAASGQVVSVR